MSIYRIVSFYELLQTLRSGKLRISSTARFSDPNEMIGSLFAKLSSPMWTPLTDEGLHKAQEEIDIIRECHYTSCWTRTRDSIAMWEIYSPNRDSVQIESSEEDIAREFFLHFEKSPYARAHNTVPNWDKTVFYPPIVGDCRYEDLSALAAKLKAKAQDYNVRSEIALREEGFDAFSAIYHEKNKDSGNAFKELFFIKNEAYRHEREVRFCLNAMRRNDREYEDCKSDFLFMLTDTYLRPATIGDTGGNIFVDFPLSSIKHVRLDARSPHWILSLQRDLLDDFGVISSVSETYGKFSDNNTVERWLK